MSTDELEALDDNVGSKIIHNLWRCGHYLHNTKGGRSGKAPILSYMHISGGSATQQELLDRFNVKSGSLSEVLSKLEADGLIVRHKDDADKRKQVISLTKEGKKRAKQHIDERIAFEASAFNCLEPEEQDQLLALLERVNEYWGEL